MIEPPQKCDPVSTKRRETAQFHVKSEAASPPTIRERIAGLGEHPHDAVALQIKTR